MSGVELIGGSAFVIALAAGMFSFLSPCVLPVVPPYLAYIGGVSMRNLDAPGNRWRITASATYFVLGLSVVYLLLGLAANAAGRAFIANLPAFDRVAGLVIIAFGLHFLGLLRLPFLNREWRLHTGRIGGGLGPFILGLGFAFGWAPCIGPQLGAILALAAGAETAQRGAMLLGVYALGLGIPFIIAALFLERASRLLVTMRPHMRRIEIAIGCLLVGVGIMMLTGSYTQLSLWLLTHFPALGAIG